MIKKILYFEGAGSQETQRNDVENCRIRTAFTTDTGKKIYLELESSGKLQEDLYVSHCHYITEEPDDCNKNRLYIERKNNRFKYTKKDILDMVNIELNCSFEQIEVLPWLSGYNVHTRTANGCNKYFLMEDYINVPERTQERLRVYYEVAKNYYDGIYQKHLEQSSRLSKQLSEYGTWAVVSMDDSTLTVKSYASSALIDDNERVKVFEVNY